MPRKQSHKNHREINFDEVIADSLADGGLNSIEQPLAHSVFRFVLFGGIAAGSIFLVRLLALGGFGYDYYLGRAEGNVNQEIPLIAPRGIIFDRNGVPLLENQAIFSVFLKANEMVRTGERKAVLKAAEEILGLSKQELIKQFEDPNLLKAYDIILKRDITREQVIAIKSLNLKSLVVENDYERQYLDPAFAHIVGYVGLVSGEDLRTDEKLVLNDLIGRTGLEAYYDEALRGENGALGIFRNAEGEIESVSRKKDERPGENLETTIDAELQKHFYSRTVEALTNLGRTSGAGIAINPQNGEILALFSLPSFDGNNVSAALSGPNRPLFNRPVSGLYSPGSTIKPIHAVAALEEGVVNSQTQIFSAGYIEIPNPYFPDQPSRFLDWKAHGWVNLRSALARSSNVYFYTVGGGFEGIRGVGIEKLRNYWEKFGLDRKTGIDLPGESTGFLPSPEEKESRTGSVWRVGDTYNVAIGQGDLVLTPLELLSATSAIASQGKAYVPHLKKTDSPELLIDVSEWDSALNEVRGGMVDAVNESYGTAYLLHDIPISIAAKTGSAQVAGNTKTNAIFIGYAPADNPQIAILILIEDAREGSLNAVPIARDVLRWYYENRL
ncbi:MAG TPA: penicillin-binding transpeptidase domain-containing protein [Candidatus Paceibacterota bacterium]